MVRCKGLKLFLEDVHVRTPQRKLLLLKVLCSFNVERFFTLSFFTTVICRSFELLLVAMLLKLCKMLDLGWIWSTEMFMSNGHASEFASDCNKFLWQEYVNTMLCSRSVNAKLKQNNSFSLSHSLVFSQMNSCWSCCFQPAAPSSQHTGCW